MSASPFGNFCGCRNQSPCAVCQPSSSVTHVKPSFFTMGQGVVNLAGLDFSTVPPGTPARTESALGRGVESYSLCDHHMAVVPQRLKVIAVVDGGERAKSLQRGPRLEHAILFELHRY